MNIIVCGIDKSGKSTICNDIRESLYPIVPVTFKITKKPSTDNFFSQQMVVKIYQEMLGQTLYDWNKSHIFLFDRAYPSEMVYSIKRGYDAMQNEDLLALDLRLADKGGTLLVYCEVDAETLKKRFKSEKEEYLKEKEIEQMLSRYEDFLKLTHLPFIRINSLTERGQNVVAVKKFIETYEHQRGERD